ncbi:MAG: hypothetical protein DMF22_01865 [Verrucomicrobia bacterium]|nr:MAG: hypothetical protein DMF22_01865 [Verrucomicrobiota bacterium]
MIPSGKYDFLLASHCLEHMANPLCAFQEWLRVLKKKGSGFGSASRKLGGIRKAVARELPE